MVRRVVKWCEMGEMCYRVSGMELVRQKWETKKGERDGIRKGERKNEKNA